MSVMYLVCCVLENIWSLHVLHECRTKGPIAESRLNSAFACLTKTGTQGSHNMHVSHSSTHPNDFL